MQEGTSSSTNRKAFLVAAPASGSGKTTIARGLMALLTSKGYRVQPFKCGPDYIDTKFHAAVCGRPSINLDTFMATSVHVRELFARYGEGADVCIVEGMMGLFDGYDRDKGSSAEIARVLDIPVVLVVDAKSAAYSMAPLLSGFINFRKDVRITGVIFNKVGSERHYQMMKDVCSDDNQPFVDFLLQPFAEKLAEADKPFDYQAFKEEQYDKLADHVRRHVDMERLYQILADD